MRFSRLTALAVELANKYEAGFLPGPGGWLDQDSLYVDLIELALAAKREREQVEARKNARRYGK